LTVPFRLFGSVAHGCEDVVDVDPPGAHAASRAPMAVIDSPKADNRKTKSLRVILPAISDWTRF